MTHETMACDALDAHLEDYLEGTLDDAARATVERHMAACTRCGELVADLSEIRMQAAALPTLRPSRDLWDGIAARIDAPVIEIGTRRDSGAATGDSTLRPRRRPVWLGAAALIVVSAGVSHVVTRQSMQDEQRPTQVAVTPVRPETVVVVREVPTQVAVAPAASRPRRAESTRPEGTRPSPEPRVSSPDAQLVARSAGDVVYDREIASLRRVLRDRQGQLDTATVRVLEQSLTIIDGAIAQSRAALARDPASAFLNQQLTNALEKKLELLRTAAALPAGRT